MSTNYYLISTNKDWIIKNFGEDYEDEWVLVDTPFFGYEVHIGKRSCGWKPLFQAHNKAYRSVKEMLEFFECEKSHFRIFDEYNVEFAIEGLIAELVSWADMQSIRRVSYTEGEFIDNLEGELIIPIDHIQFSEIEDSVREYQSYYWHDEEGYDFMNGNFC